MILASGHDQHAAGRAEEETWGQGLLFENFHVHILSTFDIEINEVWHVAPSRRIDRFGNRQSPFAVGMKDTANVIYR